MNSQARTPQFSGSRSHSLPGVAIDVTEGLVSAFLSRDTAREYTRPPGLNQSGYAKPCH